MFSRKKLLHQAMDLADDGKYLKAAEAYSQYIEKYPRDAQGYHERGMVLLELDKLEEALSDFGKALDLNPKYWGARDWRARTQENLGNHIEAANDRLQNLRLFPKGYFRSMGVNPQEWADCAESFRAAGDPDRAIELLNEYFSKYASRVTKHSRFETAPMRLLARLCIQSGSSDRARELGEKAYNSTHQCPADVLVYALALEAAEHYDLARTIAQEALESNDQMEGVVDLNQRLSRVE